MRYVVHVSHDEEFGAGPPALRAAVDSRAETIEITYRYTSYADRMFYAGLIADILGSAFRDYTRTFKFVGGETGEDT